MTTCSSEEAETLTCFLCVEPLSRQDTVLRPCCRRCELCQSCMYRHIHSIVGDDLGSFRELSCPFGCGAMLTDREVRNCLHRQHCRSWLWDTLRYFLYVIITTFFVSRAYTASVWWYLCLSGSQERGDLEKYWKWSLERGLADLRKKHDNDAILLHCPGPDCSFQWIVANPRHRRAKQQHESKPFLLWYSPFRGPDLISANFLYGPSTGDVRKMTCPACRITFCGLCRNPWVYGHTNHSYRACRDFMRHLPNSHDESAADRFTLANIARPCPGCTRRIERIDGCNHISCPCGTQWCYACGSRWNAMHYYCRDPRNEGNANAGPGVGSPDCVIL